jgi:hypothetical protein
VTQQALALAYVGSALIGSGVGVLGQTPVPVPIVQVADPYVPPLTIESAGGVTTSTGTILDLNEVANQQLEANMPWILARAAIRRAVKAIAAKAAQDAASQQSSSFGLLAGLVANIAMTAGERAETRNWTTLPAQIQVARIDVAEGLQELAFGVQTKVSVRVAAGKHSFVVVLQPNLSQPPRVLVDKYSKAPPPEQAPETIPEPATAAEPATTP